MRKEDYQATFIVMFGLAAATLTGFLRQAAIAHELGAGRTADIYLVAFAVPEFIFIALPIILWPIFIPLFSQCRQQAGEKAAWSFGLRLAGVLLAVLLGLTALAGLAAPLYLTWLAPGFSQAEYLPAMRALGIMLPAFSLMGLATLAGGALQVYRRFARPALMTAIYNLVFIATLFVAPLAWPVDRAAWGVTLGAGAALLLQLPLLWQHRPSFAGAARDEGGENREKTGPVSVSQAMRLAGPLAAGYAVHHLILFIDRAMATGLGSGSVAALSYAYHLALVVGQVSGLAVSTALFPHLAEQAGQNNLAGVRYSLGDALRLVGLIALPASIGLIVLRVPLVQLLFERGAFDRAATAAVSTPLVWYALAVLADALGQPLWRIIYAQRSAWTVLAINGLQTGVRLLANLALVSSFGYSGLALSAAIGLMIQVIVLAWLVQRRVGPYLRPGWWRDAARIGLAAAACAALMARLAAALSGLPALLVLIPAGLAGGLIYLGLLWLLGMGRGYGWLKPAYELEDRPGL